MQNVHFAGNIWEKFFHQFGLSNFNDFYDYSDGELINSNTKRNVLAFTLGENQDKKEFFMKRFFKPHYKDMLFTISNYGRLLSQGGLEWKNANNLLDINVGTYVPVCFGEDTVCGIEKQSFVITEKLTDECFTDFVRQKWNGLGNSEKTKIMAGIGRLLRKVHDAGMALPDYYAWHIYLSKRPDGEYDFSVIDLHRMKVNVKSEGTFARDMGALYHSLIDEYFDKTHKETLLEAYLGDNQSRRKKFEAKVLNREAVLNRRRHKPSYGKLDEVGVSVKIG